MPGSMAHEAGAEEVRNVLQWLEFTPEELYRFYEIQRKFDASFDAEEKHYFEQTMIRIVSGFSVKTAQREEKIASLHLILSGELNGRGEGKE